MFMRYSLFEASGLAYLEILACCVAFSARVNTGFLAILYCQIACMKNLTGIYFYVF